MTIFIVILADYSNRFDNHLMHFHSIFSAPSISKTVLENSPVLEPFKKGLLTTTHSWQEFFVFTSVLISPHNNLVWFTSISTISNSLITLFNLKIKGNSIPTFFGTSFLPPRKIDMSCVAGSNGPLSNTTLPCQISRQASYFYGRWRNFYL